MALSYVPAPFSVFRGVQKLLPAERAIWANGQLRRQIYWSPRPVHGPSENECEYCGGVLPSNRDVRFCPHCGQPQEGDLKCPACGSPVDVGWAYCLACGKPTGFE